jgi:CRISPR-associated protein Cst1
MVTLTLGDWLYNAGITGLVNILKHSGDEVIYNGQDVSFRIDSLDNFEEKFFNYFIDIYEKKLAWSKIVCYAEEIERFELNDYKNFDEKALEYFNKYIEDIKIKIKSNSHKAAYELISNKFPVLEKEKKLKKIKLKKKETVDDKINEIKSITRLVQI